MAGSCRAAAQKHLAPALFLQPSRRRAARCCPTAAAWQWAAGPSPRATGPSHVRRHRRRRRHCTGCRSASIPLAVPHQSAPSNIHHAADADLESIKHSLGVLAAPEQFYGANYLRLRHDASGTVVRCGTSPRLLPLLHQLGSTGFCAVTHTACDGCSRRLRAAAHVLAPPSRCCRCPTALALLSALPAAASRRWTRSKAGCRTSQVSGGQGRGAAAVAFTCHCRSLCPLCMPASLRPAAHTAAWPAGPTTVLPPPPDGACMPPRHAACRAGARGGVAGVAGLAEGGCGGARGADA